MPSIAVIVACSPVLRPLLHLWLLRLKSRIHSRLSAFTWNIRHNNDTYSDISNDELPLQELGKFNSITAGSSNSANFMSGTVAGANAAALDSPAQEGGSEPHIVQVKNEFSVRSLANSQGQEVPCVQVGAIRK